MKMILLPLIALTSTHAFALTPAQYAELFTKKNHDLEKLDLALEEQKMLIDSNWGRYIPQLQLQGAWSKDKSDPLSPQLPHHQKLTSEELRLTQNTGLGVNASIALLREDTNYDQATTTLAREKSQISAGLTIDLLKNIGGRLDRNLKKNWKTQKQNAVYSRQGNAEEMLYQAFSLYAQYNRIIEQKKVTQEIEKNALGLLAVAEKRNKQGLKNQRELFIYRSNLTSIQTSLLQLENARQELSSVLLQLIDANQKDASQFAYTYTNLDLPSDLITYAQEKNWKNSLLQGLMEADQRAVKNSEYQLLPKLELQTTWMGIGNQEKWQESLDDSLGRDKERFAVNLTLSFPLSFQAEKDALAANRASYNASVIEKQEYARKHLLNRQKMLDQYQLAIQKEELSKKHRMNESQKYQNELREFKSGLRNTLDVVQFQNDFLKAKLSEVEASWDRFMLFNKYLAEEGSLTQYYSRN